MAVPYIFSNVPGGSSIPLSELDANFAYLTTSPIITNPTFNGTITFNGIPMTGPTGTGNIVLSNGGSLTPAYINLTNGVNLPLSTGISGFGSGWVSTLGAGLGLNWPSALGNTLGSGWDTAFAQPFSSINGVTSVDVSGGTTGLSFTGGPVTSIGVMTMSGVLAPSNGGTGITTIGTGVQAALSNAVGSASGFLVAGATPISQFSVVVGGGSGTLTTIPTGSTNQILQSNGATAAPDWSTATYPTTTPAGTVLASPTLDGVVATYNPVLGVPGSILGGITIAGSGVGTVTLNAPAIPANAIITLPSTTGTLLTATGAFTAGSVVFADSTGALTEDNPNFFWDNTNNRLGIGTAVPPTGLYSATTSASALSALGTLSAAIVLDFATFNNFSMTLVGNSTLSNPVNMTIGQSGTIYVTQDATGTRTLAFGTYWDFANQTAPSISTTANAVDVIIYSVRSATSIVATLITNVG